MSRYQVDKAVWGGAEKVDALLQDIRCRRMEFEEQKYISQDVIEVFKEIGIFRAFVPREFGGDERSPGEFLLLIESISAAYGSAGWVASFGMNPAYLAALPLDTIKQVWKDSPDVVFAGGIFPPQTAALKDGQYNVSGCWSFGSGCMGASLIGVGIKDESNPLPRMAVLPREQVTIVQDSWDVHGMRGTGSFDLKVNAVDVPQEWTFVRGSKPNLDTDFFRYPALTFAAQVLSVTALGIAREALDIVIHSAKGRKSVTGAPNLGERSYVQTDIAKAEAKLQSIRSFFYDSTEALWDCIQQGKAPTRELISMTRLATSNVAHEAAEVTRTAYRLAGMSGIYNEHPLSTCFRDAHLVTQHAFMGEITFQNAGAIMFGHDPLPGYL